MFQLIIAYALFAEGLARLAQQIQKMTEIGQDAQRTAKNLQDKWTGNDADAFQQFIQSDIFNPIQSLIGVMNDWSSRLTQARDTMQQADNKAKQMVGQLSDVFGKIIGA